MKKKKVALKKLNLGKDTVSSMTTMQAMQIKGGTFPDICAYTHPPGSNCPQCYETWTCA